MLREIRVTNFRTFEEEITVRLRPITVLIGKNSSGKSSIIKFLLMLQQSLDPSATHFLESEGDRVHLGAFPDLKNSKSKGRTLRFQLQFTTSALPSGPEREIMEKIEKARFEKKDNRLVLQAVVSHPAPSSTVKQEEATFTVSATVGYSRTGQRGTQKVVAVMDDEVLLERESTNIRPETGTPLLRFRAQATSPEEALREYFLDRYLLPIRSELRSLKHLSAIREESQRVVVVSSPPSDSVGQRGEYATPHLQRLLKEGGDGAAFVLCHIQKVAGIVDLEFDLSMKGYLAHCKARNIETGAKAYLSDFGFGVSQCIPLFVQGAITPREYLMMVEQPEAQLHPNAQLELGAFFAELWTQRGVLSLIETHSSNMLLRLRRLIAAGKLDCEDVSVAYVHVENGKSTVTNLDIQEDGGLEAGLPMQFFGGDVKEGILLGARK